jgi:hypothetical protein
VAMVALVVVLLTTAILFRSFERSKNASNVRVNEASLNAAAPAIDRASAKLEQLLNDPSLPRSTPTDIALYDVIKSNRKYDFGDETRLKVAYDINSGGITTNPTILENDETVSTAWKFPIDTDNNGKFDTYTLYAIYFRSPTRDNTNKFNRSRNPLEARTPPMDKSQVGGACADAVGTSASLVGDSSWYKSGGTLAKSFYVYTVNIPIDSLGSLPTSQYEPKKGNTGFSALEYQQDRERIPVNSKAVWFENDLEITPGSNLDLNGAVHTNGNLLAGGQYSGVAITFRQVSSKNSCFYEQENAKITIGGNIGTGNVSQTTNNQPLTIDLFQGYKVNPTSLTIGGTGDKSTTANGGRDLGHNDAAYNKRINKMKEEALALCLGCSTKTTVAALKTGVEGIARYPKEIKDNFEYRVDPPNIVTDVPTAYKILSEEVELYLRNRTRRVPYAIVTNPIPTDTEALAPYASGNVFSGSGEIEVPPEWREITTSNTGLTLNLDKLPGTEPEQQKEDGKENYTGDRVLAGNNLPAYWKNDSGDYVTGDKARHPVDSGTTKWNKPAAPKDIARTRASQIQPQLNLGVTERNDFWEQKAAEDVTAANPLANVGGLRVITGAGIYVDDDGVTRSGETPVYSRNARSFLPAPQTIFPPSTTTPGLAGLDENFVHTGTTPVPAGQMAPPSQFRDTGTEVSNIVVLPDSMPMTAPNETRTGDLLMRATAVYHYKSSTAVTDETPIACVSSYYDPTNAITAQNANSLPWNNASGGRSNNGIAYNFPGRTISSIALNILKRQARLVFPNGRIANEPLRVAMQKYTSNGNNFNNFTMADYSAVDTALCAISILNSATPNSGTIAHGRIREASFLDAREVKALQNETSYRTSVNQGQYDLDLEQRQPLEVRVTEIDLGYLASTTYAISEYLLPKSGILYITRDDALPDLSYKTVDPTASTDEEKLFSQTDYKLDPTRRPSGIRLINGSTLARGGTNSGTYDPSEKGLIFVSNLPVYVKGNFNLHRTTVGGAEIEEFSDTTNSFYNQATPNNNFACRPGRTGCPTTGGDLWRPSTIIADAITLLSDTFQDGFRNHGDYDLRNNAISLPGADLVNNFVTSANWADSNGYPNTNSSNYFKTSYLANGVTPIQRRANFNEYLMEVCIRVPASTCTDNDWYIRPPVTGITPLRVSDIIANGTVALDITGTHQAGTTAQPAAPQYQGYIRRVAFDRASNNNLKDASGNEITASGALPVPLGISGTGGTVQRFPYNTFNTTRPRLVTNRSALWFRTTSNAALITNIANANYTADSPLFIQGPLPSGTQQPQLVPVLQIYSPLGSPNPSNSNDLDEGAKTPGIQRQWVQAVTSNTTFNTGLVSGNSPSRPDEESAGLGNFVRFLEFWGGDGTTQHTARIRGNFIQFKRNTYATAPFASVLRATASTTASTSNNLSWFDYAYNAYWTNKGLPEGTLAYYTPPRRDWGFDIALLSQLPDLFAQRFTVPPSAPPAEFFREVSRDDQWVKALLCAKEKPSGATATYSIFAVPGKYRSNANCPTTNSYPD